ncbi:DNA-processing protein DprA [Cytobacillus sp. S13-E01]|uniref:DNA-processing protein DprA n=1 Tax=Cytobacillus sp. S13-E01 TaxID=3031326 RepID=UPI0023D85A97|nr:DNA-processing protein DprA [Cytobacillus sp. S13-E01]MDF0728909.1 DNA-processing protein DprA [Cytobacillus sp. S13-E01]
MQFTNNEIATYLFCAQLAQTKTTPLTILEWNAVVKSLSEQKMQPEALFKITPSELLKALTKATEAQKVKIVKKIEARQKLGISMLELKEVVHQGYGIMFRSQMPNCLKKLTQKFIPAFFYYVGDASILSHRTLGVVGARDANDDELSQTAEIAKEAVLNGVVIISGGARGVDTTAVEASLENGGKAIVFPADGLSKWVKKSAIRNYVLKGQLLLMSSQRLDAPFSGSYAMQRNKFIHAPSNAVLVASSKISGKKSSGTWEGVMENIKHQWSPLYVLGKSEGVEKLKAEGNAKEFSSFEDIFIMQSEPTKNNNQTEIDEKMISLIKLAITKGLDKEIIEKKFLEISAKYYNNKQDSKQDNEREGQDIVAQEQLTLEL